MIYDFTLNVDLRIRIAGSKASAMERCVLELCTASMRNVCYEAGNLGFGINPG
jgi:hypothetical protein